MHKHLGSNETIKLASHAMDLELHVRMFLKNFAFLHIFQSSLHVCVLIVNLGIG